MSKRAVIYARVSGDDVREGKEGRKPASDLVDILAVPPPRKSQVPPCQYLPPRQQFQRVVKETHRLHR
jgi:hypothetical protein